MTFSAFQNNLITYTKIFKDERMFHFFSWYLVKRNINIFLLDTQGKVFYNRKGTLRR